MVTRGKIKGTDAAQAIVDFLNTEYGGLSEELMNTYDAKAANLKDVETNVEEGYGTGYNEERKGAVTTPQPVRYADSSPDKGKRGMEEWGWLGRCA